MLESASFVDRLSSFKPGSSDPNEEIDFEGFPLFYAASIGDISKVNILIESKADLDKLYTGFQNPTKPDAGLKQFSSILVAVTNKHREIVELLIQNKARVDTWDDFHANGLDTYDVLFGRGIQDSISHLLNTVISTPNYPIENLFRRDCGEFYYSELRCVIHEAVAPMLFDFRKDVTELESACAKCMLLDLGIELSDPDGEEFTRQQIIGEIARLAEDPTQILTSTSLGFKMLMFVHGYGLPDYPLYFKFVKSHKTKCSLKASRILIEGHADLKGPLHEGLDFIDVFFEALVMNGDLGEEDSPLENSVELAMLILENSPEIVNRTIGKTALPLIWLYSEIRVLAANIEFFEHLLKMKADVSLLHPTRGISLLEYYVKQHIKDPNPQYIIALLNAGASTLVATEDGHLRDYLNDDSLENNAIVRKVYNQLNADHLLENNH
jgi:hypothetical protein